MVTEARQNSVEAESSVSGPAAPSAPPAPPRPDPSFRFWTPDYTTGVDKFFAGLNRGITYSENYLDMFRTRMEAEQAYGATLSTCAKMAPDQSDSLTVGLCLSTMCSEITREGELHTRLAEMIRTLIVGPLRRFSINHRAKIQEAESNMRNLIEDYYKKMDQVRAIKDKYYNKCRVYDDFRDQKEAAEAAAQAAAQADTVSASISEGAAFSSVVDTAVDPVDPETKPDVKADAEIPPSNSAPSTRESTPQTDSASVGESAQEPIIDVYKLANVEYEGAQLKDLLAKMLKEIPRGPARVYFMNYTEVSSGSDIGEWIQSNTDNRRVALAELFGQDLLEYGFLGTVGPMNRYFVMSSTAKYQWKPAAFQAAGLASNRDGSGAAESVPFREYLGEVIQNATGSQPAEILGQKLEGTRLEKEISSLREKYLQEVDALDAARSLLESTYHYYIVDLQKEELHRYTSLKKFTLDFTTLLSNNVASLTECVDRLDVCEQSIKPSADFQLFADEHESGPFTSKVVQYENYHGAEIHALFGYDLGLLNEADFKAVRLLVFGTLSYLDDVYTKRFSTAEECMTLWLTPMNVLDANRLRARVNKVGSFVDFNDLGHIYAEFPPQVVADVFKLYLVQMPDSLVSSDDYMGIKAGYERLPIDLTEEYSEKIELLREVVNPGNKYRKQVMRAIINHLRDLLQLVSEKLEKKEKSEETEEQTSAITAEEFKQKLAVLVAPYFLRPGREVASYEEGGAKSFVPALVLDIFNYHSRIFQPKRQNSNKSRK